MNFILLLKYWYNDNNTFGIFAIEYLNKYPICEKWLVNEKKIHICESGGLRLDFEARFW